MLTIDAEPSDVTAPDRSASASVACFAEFRNAAIVAPERSALYVGSS